MITLRAIADLCAYTGPDEVVRVLGYHSINDGGGGTFVWRLNNRLPEGVYADKGIYFETQQTTGIISTGNGLWERLDRDQVSVKWYGARGNGTDDDTQAIQAALNSGSLRVYVPYTGKGYSTTGVEIPDSVSLIGCSSISADKHRRATLQVVPGPEHFGVRSRENAGGGSLEDIAISGAPGCAFGLYVSTENFRTSNVMVHGFTDAAGVIMGHNRRSVHTNLHISGCGIGLFLDGAIGSLHAVVFTGLVIRLCVAGIFQRGQPGGLPSCGNVFTGATIEAIGYATPPDGATGAVSLPPCLPLPDAPENIASRFEGGIHMEGNFQAAFVGLFMDAVSGAYVEYEHASGAGALSFISCNFGFRRRRSISALLSDMDTDLFHLSGTPVHVSGCSFRYHETETSAPAGMDGYTNDLACF